MTENELMKRLQALIACENASLIAIRNVLLEYKNQGGNQNDAEIMGNRLRTLNSGNNIADDKALEVLDIITGWCAPNLKVW